jgi:hypothetical protein
MNAKPGTEDIITYKKRLQQLERDKEKLEKSLLEREAIMSNLFSFIEGNSTVKG